LGDFAGCRIVSASHCQFLDGRTVMPLHESTLLPIR